MNDIVQNPFYKFLFSPGLSAEEKRDQIAIEISRGAQNPVLKREGAQALQDISEFLQGERKRLAQAIIKMTDIRSADTAPSIAAMREANNGMQNVYAILTEAAKKADPDAIDSTFAVDFAKTYADLSSQAVRLKQMSDGSVDVQAARADLLLKIAQEGMILTQPITVRSKPLAFRQRFAMA